MLTTAAVISFYKPWGRIRRSNRTPAAKPAETPVVLREVRQEAEGVVSLELADPQGRPLPQWVPGAHVDLVLPSGKVRQYSLCSDPGDTGTYRVGILREPEGRGGSVEAHALRPGQALAIRGPRNNFPLADAPAYLFIAGGIGITPLIPMLHQVAAAGKPWRLVYGGRSFMTMAYLDELRQFVPQQIQLVPQDTAGLPDLEGALRGAPEGCAVYCCGPEGLINAVEQLVPTACPSGQLHVERFAAADVDHGEKVPFELELARSEQQLHVPADRSTLEVLREVRPELDASCEDGVCGTCVLSVLSGVPEHRDSILASTERDRTDVFYPCVSRARSQRLVVDL
ncbi:PDR/VanB family oxidoreductase [Saccharopolyspora indica]|nr:PDR/VanB family oxidoreductase [Saccharopolyspora indica]MDA3647681.1 PDR/VanB family oxidoreductase [Saccharopolyspora indica]